MKPTTVLFDLDGTLLPMDTDAFIGLYAGLMGKKLVPLGYDKEGLMKAIWGGVAAMVRNDGSRLNEAVFWDCFRGVFGAMADRDRPVIDDFYRDDFPGVRAACGSTPMAKATLEKCRELGLRVALATNPVFPAVATYQRIAWAGLRPEDFEIVTTYENSSSCKPSLLYYEEVMGKLRVRPEECLMVGNDVDEDMVARELGLRVFLLTPCLLNKHGEEIGQFPHGDFPELIGWLEETAAEG